MNFADTFKYYNDKLPHHREYAKAVESILANQPLPIKQQLIELWRKPVQSKNEQIVKYLAEELAKVVTGNRSSNLRQNGAAILDACEQHGLGTVEEIAYVLATASWESEFACKAEVRASLNDPVRELQDNYWSSGYYGRGFCQLTWKDNYRKLGRALGIELLRSPDLALEPVVAANILVVGMRDGLFTGRKLASAINKTCVDYRRARMTIGANASAHIAEIASWYAKHLNGFFPSIKA
jgi:hypothetical protein